MLRGQERSGGAAAVGSWGVLVLVLIALGFRVWGSGWGLPYLYHPDEDKIVSHALAFGKGDLNPHYFGWPSLQMYVMFLIYGCYFLAGWLVRVFGSPEDFVVAFAVDPSTFYLLGRWLSALLGALTVCLVYVVGRRLYGKGVGLLGALFLAVNYVHVKDSHYITPDVPLAFVVMAAFWLAVRVSEEPRLGNYVAAGVLTGLAISVKYPGFIVGISLLVAHLLAVRARPAMVGLLSGRAGLGAALIPLAFWIGTPYSLIDGRSFLVDLRHQQIQVSQPLPAIAGLATLLVENPLSALGAGVYALALGGAIWCLFRRGRPDLLLLSLPGAHLAFLLLTGGLSYRHLSVALPFFALLAALFLVELGNVLRSLRILSVRQANGFVLAGALAVIVQPFWQSVTLDLSLSQLDTRTRAKEWMERNVPGGSAIALAHMAPPVLPLATEARNGVVRPPTIEEWRLHRDQITEGVIYGNLKAARLGEQWRRYDALIDRERDRVFRNRPRYRILELTSLPDVVKLRLKSGEIREEDVAAHRENQDVLEPERLLKENDIEYVVLSSSMRTSERWRLVLAQGADLIYRVEGRSAWWGGRLPFYSFHNPTLEVYRLRNPEKNGA